MKSAVGYANIVLSDEEEGIVPRDIETIEVAAEIVTALERERLCRNPNGQLARRILTKRGPLALQISNRFGKRDRILQPFFVTKTTSSKRTPPSPG